MENMRSILVYMNSLDFFAVNISACMISSFQYKTAFPCLTGKISNHSGIQTGANQNIIIFLHCSFSLQFFPKSRPDGIDKELQSFLLVLSLAEQLNFVSAFDACAKDT